MWINSVQFSRSVVSDSLRPHEPQDASLPVHHQLPESTQTHVHQVDREGYIWEISVTLNFIVNLKLH